MHGVCSLILMKRFFPTYQGRESILEIVLVVVVLVPSVVVPGCRPVDFLAATAVLLTFLCTQSSFDMNERLIAHGATNESGGYRYPQLFLLKEAMWVVTFVVIGNLPLVASTVVFASYPHWRRWLRGNHATPALGVE